MNRDSIITTALIVTIALGASVADAGNGGDRKRGVTFEMLDTNADGQISREEMDARGEARFAQLDADGDGLVTSAELESSQFERVRERSARMIKRIDSDGDGAISLEEMTARRGGSDRMFNRLDGNEDGQISEEEFAKAQERGFGRQKRGD